MFNIKSEETINSFSVFNRKMDRYVDQTLDRLCHYLPTQDCNTEAKIILLWLANTVFLQFTIGNPLIPAYIGYSAGVASVLPSVKPLYRSIKLHVKSCIERISVEKRTQCIFAAFVLTSLGITSLMGTVYLIPNKKEYACMGISFALWMTFLNVSMNLVSSSCFFDRAREKKELFSLKMKNKTDKIIEDIDFLQSKIKKLDDFIHSKEDLRELVCKYIKKFPEYIIDDIDFSCDNLSMEDEIQKMTIYAIKKNEYEHYLEERIRFIERHREVYRCFYKHVKEMRTSENMGEVLALFASSESTFADGEFVSLEESIFNGASFIVKI